MKNIKRYLFLIILCISTSVIGCSPKEPQPQENNLNEEIVKASNDEEAYKILYVMSYHSPWEWTDSQFSGFKKGIADKGVGNMVYEVFQMDTKNKSSVEWKEAVGQEAVELIHSWEPDLVYTSDDNAQEYVTKRFINTEIPFVFSAVNQSPEVYGFDNSTNVTGVLEIEHFKGSLELFKKIVPDAKKIALIFDDSEMWEPVKERISEQLVLFPDMEFEFVESIKTYEQYQNYIKDYENKIDGLCLLGIFNFKDSEGNNVPHHDVLTWTAHNSNIPDFSFWIDRVDHGTLCSVSVSGYEQGYEAGLLAGQILNDGVSPLSLEMHPTIKGQAAINLKRAQALNIEVDSKTLLSSVVVNTYKGDE